MYEVGGLPSAGGPQVSWTDVGPDTTATRLVGGPGINTSVWVLGGGGGGVEM